MQRIVRSPDLNTLLVEYPNGWLGFLGMTVAMASYYGFETAVESELSNGREVRVDRIGTFRPEESRVTFLASAEFTNMLAANLKMKVE